LERCKKPLKLVDFENESEYSVVSRFAGRTSSGLLPQRAEEFMAHSVPKDGTHDVAEFDLGPIGYWLSFVLFPVIVDQPVQPFLDGYRFAFLKVGESPVIDLPLRAP